MARMLGEFIGSNQEHLVALCTARAARRSDGTESAQAREFGTARFLGALVLALATNRPGESEMAQIDAIAARRGMEMLAQGVPVDWVIHEYGDLCQAIIQLAQRRKQRISAREFEALNGCLDNAIAAAVSEYVHQRELLALRENSAAMHERLGRLADELRVPLASALATASVMRAGGAVTGESLGLQGDLDALRAVIDRSLAEIRLESVTTSCPESIAMADFIRDLGAWAQMEALGRGCRLEISPVSEQLAVYADRLLLSSALKQLLGAAFKSMRENASVAMRVLATDSRVFVEIEDRGASPGENAAARRPVLDELRGASRGETNPECALAKRGLEQVGGRLRMRDLAGGGRLSSVDLPRLRLSSVY